MERVFVEGVEHCDAWMDCGFVSLGYAKVLILGVIQGITELLPISSTAHMRAVPALLGWSDPGSAFSAAMQLAGFFAIAVYFRKEINTIIVDSFYVLKTRDFSSARAKLPFCLFIGTIPIIIGGLWLKSLLNQPGTPLRSLYVIGGSSIVMAVLLFIAEKKGRRNRDMKDLTLKDGLWVGLAQVGALIPGVSRSGSTLTAGLFLGMKRETAAAFSFLLGVPAICGAGLKEMYELYKAHLTWDGWCILFAGLVAASLSAFLAVFFLLKYLENHTTYVFVWYRFLLGVLLILGAYFAWFQ